MNPNFGYQLYQAQRIKSRAEVLSTEARRGHAAAAAARGGRRNARPRRALAALALNALSAITARATARAT